MDSKDASENQGEEIIFGTGWQATPTKLSIHHDGLILLVAAQGFCQIKVNGIYRLVRIVGNIIELNSPTTRIVHIAKHPKESIEVTTRTLATIALKASTAPGLIFL